MGSLDENFIFAIVLLLGAVLYAARLVAIKTNHDPIMRRTKLGTPEREVYQKYMHSRRFTVTLAVSVAMIPLSLAYIIYAMHMLLREGTPSAHYMLIFGPISATITFVIAIWLMYYLIIKK